MIREPGDQETWQAGIPAFNFRAVVKYLRLALQYSCLETPMDRGCSPWQAAVHGVAKSRTGLSDFPFTFHFHALEKEMATHSSVPVFLPGESQGWRSLVGCRLWGRTESDTTDVTQHSNAEASVYHFYRKNKQTKKIHSYVRMEGGQLPACVKLGNRAEHSSILLILALSSGSFTRGSCC